MTQAITAKQILFKVRCILVSTLAQVEHIQIVKASRQQQGAQRVLLDTTAQKDHIAREIAHQVTLADLTWLITLILLAQQEHIGLLLAVHLVTPVQQAITAF